MGKSAADVALVLNAMHGFDARDSTSHNRPDEPGRLFVVSTTNMMLRMAPAGGVGEWVFPTGCMSLKRTVRSDSVASR